MGLCPTPRGGARRPAAGRNPRMSTPSISIDPASGETSPRMHLSSTDLPLPEPPITTSEVPAGTSRSTPSSTCLVPKRLARPRIRMRGVAVLIG